ncbi:hypothetical protein MGA3_15611 [Bacillus methanolicus MGA3]|nr:hypothetical protein MGA3_15611 [Bacillus methanolicus MGA3]
MNIKIEITFVKPVCFFFDRFFALLKEKTRKYQAILTFVQTIENKKRQFSTDGFFYSVEKNEYPFAYYWFVLRALW